MNVGFAKAPTGETKIYSDDETVVLNCKVEREQVFSLSLFFKNEGESSLALAGTMLMSDTLLGMRSLRCFFWLTFQT